MDNMLSARQLAKALGVSHQTIYTWSDSGRLKAYTDEIGRRRFDLADGMAAKNKPKPMLRREAGLPENEPAVIGYCYSDKGTIRVRWKDDRGNVHDQSISISTSTACDAEDTPLPAEEYLSPHRPVDGWPEAAPNLDLPDDHPDVIAHKKANLRGYSFVDPDGNTHAIGLDDKGGIRHNISPPEVGVPINDKPCVPKDATEADQITQMGVFQCLANVCRDAFYAPLPPTTGVPNDIGPPPPIAFEFDDEPTATPFT